MKSIQGHDPNGKFYTVRLGDYYNRGSDGDQKQCRNNRDQKIFYQENKKFKEVESEFESKIQKVVKHPNWDGAAAETLGGAPYDIALIKLEDCIPEFNT